MRILIMVFVLTIAATSPVQAGALTRGNFFAEGLAGCSLGIAFGIVSSLVFADVEPVVAGAVHNFSILSYCLLGSALATSMHGLMELSDIGQNYFDPHGALDKRIPMVYPETPGRVY